MPRDFYAQSNYVNLRPRTQSSRDKGQIAKDMSPVSHKNCLNATVLMRRDIIRFIKK